MNLINDLINDLNKKTKVKDVRIGLHWTAIKSKYCGLAMTIPPAYHKCFITNCGNLTTKSILSLAEYAKSWNLTEASIGIAAINSLIKPGGKRINIFDFIYNEFNERKNKIVIVGHFPDKNIDTLREIGDVQILERSQQKGDFPDTAAEYLLPKADIVLMSGTTIINKSAERLLELGKNSFTVVFGPSTPMSDVLFKYGADVIGGARVKNPENVMKKVSEGAHTRDLMDDMEFLMKINK